MVYFIFRMYLLRLFVLFILLIPGQSIAASWPPLFEHDEMRYRNLKPFPKWREVVSRYKDEKKLPVSTCNASKTPGCHFKKWDRIVKKMAGKTRLQQIHSINRHMNKVDYVIDPINWGLKDYWASPGQFLSKDGDCEDYAISKYMALKELGFSVNDMRIVVLNDLNLGVIHAILVVHHEGELLVLDNQIKDVVSTDKIYHYEPIYSINEKAWWRHS